ncbi:hypothetical protein PMAYCL1PPCAC_19826, partial [Pristionchus mayeri]
SFSLMRIALLLAVTTLPVRTSIRLTMTRVDQLSGERIYWSDRFLIREISLIYSDSVLEKKAYFAFKLNNEKLLRKVLLIQELSMQREQQRPDIHGNIVPLLNTSFVSPSELELRIAAFYYDEAEQKDELNLTFSCITQSLCALFPRFLTFDQFVLDNGLIRGRLQDAEIDEKPLMKILNEHGFTHRNSSDVSRGVDSGFVVVRKHKSLESRRINALMPAAKVFLQKPLRTSVFVDTLYVCTENSSGRCDEIAWAKIENCLERTKEL